MVTDEMSTRRPARRVYIFLVISSFLFVLLAVVARNASGLYATRSVAPSWMGPDLDTQLIHAGLLRAPHLSDTVRWWTGPWVMGNFAPFYRPLTSELFWLEWKAFGDREYLYVLPTLLAHIAATALFSILVYRLATLYRLPLPVPAAFFAGWCFAGMPGPILNRDGVASVVALVWKNQPDSMAALCCFVALLFYLLAQAGKESSLIGAVIAYLAACAFKEIAIPLPMVFAALECWPPKGVSRAQTKVRLGAIAMAAGFFLVIRYCAISGPGYTYGTNHEWLRRTLQEMLGPFYGLAGGEWLSASLAIWVCVVLWGYGHACRGNSRAPRQAQPADVEWSRWLPKLTCGLIMIGGMCVLGFAALPASDRSEWRAPLSPLGLATGLLMSLQPVVLQSEIAALALIASVYLLVRHNAGLLLLGFVWLVAFLAPLVVSGGPVHRYYLPQAGYILVYSFAAGLALDRCMRRYSLGQARPRPTRDA